MTDLEKQRLGKTLWGIADQLRGAMNADDFRDYMLLSTPNRNVRFSAK